MTNKGKLSVAEVAALLREFDDAAGVAFLCDMFDVRGARRFVSIGYGVPYTCRCPIARLTQKLTGIEEHRISAAGEYLYVAQRSNRERRIESSQSTACFIREYDCGMWPELIEAT